MNADSKSDAAPRLRDRLKEATRSAILDAAETVFARDGVQGARMEDVAGSAGVAVGTLYNYFEDRHALLEALLEARRAELLACIDAALEPADLPFESTLQAMLTVIFDYYRQHLGLFALHMEAELVLRARGSYAASAMQAVFERMVRLVEAGVAGGALRAKDADLYPPVLMGMLRGVFMRHIRGIGAPPDPDSAVRLARIFLHGAAREVSR